MKESQGLIKRSLLLLWGIINTSRKIIINFVFFIVLIGVIAAISTSEDKIIIPDGGALVLNLSGTIVEQKSKVMPFDAIRQEMDDQQEDAEILLSDILDVIEKARFDSKIHLLVLKLGNLKNSGITKLSEISSAINFFKATGKEVIAIGDYYSQEQYYLASFADEIWLDPNGGVMIEGYGRYQQYYRSALEKLSISRHIFRVGTFKSAVEPFMRDNMSSEAKEANKAWLNDLWQEYKTTVAKQRDFGIENFDETSADIIEKLTQAQGKFSLYALDNHWVDQLKTRDQIKQALIEKVGKNKDGNHYKHIVFNQYLKATTPPIKVENPVTDKIAIVVAKGTILNGNQPSGTIGGDSTASLLRKARLNDKVKAVVLRVDSPGGSAFASDVIRQEVDLLKSAGKPVVASMGSYAASGGYWISASANKIVASPTTITGSIGVFGLFMTLENSLSQLGIHTDGVATTEFAGLSPTRPLSEGMGTIIQLSVENIYREFLTLVAKNRNMTVDEVDSIAEGRVWSGLKAKELGLVDELGDLESAINLAAQIAGLDSNFDTLLIEKELSAKEKFIKELLGNAVQLTAEIAPISQSPVEKVINQMMTKTNEMAQLNDPQGVYSLCFACQDNP